MADMAVEATEVLVDVATEALVDVEVVVEVVVATEAVEDKVVSDFTT